MLICQSVACILLATSTLLIADARADTTQRGVIEIDLRETKQRIMVVGGDMERSANSLLDAADPEEIARWAFSDISFNICRVQFDKHQERHEGQRTFEFYKKQVDAMKLIKKVNPKIEFFAVQRSDYNGYHIDDGNNFPTWVYDPKRGRFQADKHGRFLADFLTHMHREGIPIRYLSCGKEITQLLDASLVLESIHSMHRHLDAAGVPRPLMVEPSAWSLPQAINFMEQVEKLGTTDVIPIFSTHNYANHGEAEWQTFVKAAAQAGASAWDSESGLDHIDNGIAEPPFARQVNSMVNRFKKYRAGIQGEIFFELWSRGIGQETRPIYFQERQHGTRMRAYYIIKHWTNSALGSTVVSAAVRAPATIDAIAFNRNQVLHVWAANLDSEKSANLRIKLRNGEMNDKAASSLLWTNETPIDGSERTLDRIDANGCSIELPPNSFAAIKLRLK
jgi:O-glycosyl hydrolase